MANVSPDMTVLTMARRKLWFLSILSLLHRTTDLNEKLVVRQLGVLGQRFDERLGSAWTRSR